MAVAVGCVLREIRHRGSRQNLTRRGRSVRIQRMYPQPVVESSSTTKVARFNSRACFKDQVLARKSAFCSISIIAVRYH